MWQRMAVYSGLSVVVLGVLAGCAEEGVDELVMDEEAAPATPVSASGEEAGLEGNQADSLSEAEVEEALELLPALNGAVQAICTRCGGLVLGGAFTDAAGIPEADHIVRFDGQSWVAVGEGLNGPVRALAYDSNQGKLFIGGTFTDAGGIPDVDGLTIWNGTRYMAMGSPFAGEVRALQWDGISLWVGGHFQDAGDVQTADYLARWQQGSFYAVGSGVNGPVNALARHATYGLFVGGNFTNVGGFELADYLVRWSNGWVAPVNSPSSPLNGPVFSLVAAPPESSSTRTTSSSLVTVLVGGGFTNPGSEFATIWNPSGWRSVPGLDGPVYALAEKDGTYYVGGAFTHVNGDIAGQHAVSWSAGTFNFLSGGLNANVYSVAAGGGGVVMGGDFTNAGGNDALDYAARWEGGHWTDVVSATR